ncbi:MAG: hypothetical protein J1F14_08280 [Treponema sp.]|nr:hypothetical protein [Treponema sp.]
MKLSKLALALSTLVCLGGVFIVSGCKDTFGDGDVSGKKWNKTMTVDATADATNAIKVGDKIIVSYNGEDTDFVIADDSATGNDDYKLKNTGKRYFTQISSGAKNQGIRTEIVINKANLKNTATGRTAVVGLIFDMNEYKGADNKDVYDFSLVGINPENKKYYVERYTNVTKKAAADGVYSKAVSQLGKSYYLTSPSSNFTKWSAAATETGTPAASLPSLKDKWIVDDGETFTIGVDIKQEEAGTYIVKLGKITSDAKGKTTFEGDTVAEISVDSFGDTYENWSKDNAGYLQGEIAVYGFAPYGTKIEAQFNTGKTKAESGEQDENTDYVNAFSLAGDVEDDVYAPSLF